MKLSELYFDLPSELIAQEPVRPADRAKLMVLNLRKQKITSDIFYNIEKYLKEGDVLVFNNSKVMPARLIGKKESGGKVEILLLKEISINHWEAMVKGGSGLIGKKIILSKKLSAFIEQKKDDTFIVHFSLKGLALKKEILRIGKVPTPPYIKNMVKMSDYQNIFAKKLGSVAAPTAGLHFTKRLFAKLKKKGVQIEFVTLHVGLGTFQPIKVNRVENHQIHSEYFEVDAPTIKRLSKAKLEKRRVIAVGTTSCRVLESVASRILSTKYEIRNSNQFRNYNFDVRFSTNIFIYPGYRFKVIDGLITNFHTPYSSLLALVFAFAGKTFTKKAYTKAVKEKWRFFSLGDGMFIY